MKTYHIQLKKHRSAKSIVLAWCRWKHPRIPEVKLLKMDMELVIKVGKKQFKSASANDFIKFLKTLKVWGFCEHKCDCTKIIHIWFTKTAEYDRILECMSHEIEHASGTHNEKRCCKTGGIALYASHLIDNDLHYKRIK